MATYTPAVLIPEGPIPNSVDGTWEKQCSAGAGGSDIHRTTRLTRVAGTEIVSLYAGALHSEATAQRLVRSFNVEAAPKLSRTWSWWVVVPNTHWFLGVLDSGSIGGLNGISTGYTYA